MKNGFSQFLWNSSLVIQTLITILKKFKKNNKDTPFYLCSKLTKFSSNKHVRKDNLRDSSRPSRFGFLFSDLDSDESSGVCLEPEALFSDAWYLSPVRWM